MTARGDADDSVSVAETELLWLIDSSVREAAQRLRDKYPNIGPEDAPFGMCANHSLSRAREEN